MPSCAITGAPLASTMVKIASAPHSRRSVARHFGWPRPPPRTGGWGGCWLAPTAPFVGEQHLGAGVVEGRRMPVREIRVCHRGDAHRVRGIADVEQESVAFARAAGEPDRRIHRDVVA